MTETTVDESRPPTYAEATTPPPSYQSLFGEINDVRRQSNNFAKFLMKLIAVLTKRIGFRIFLGVLLAIPTSMIVIGAKYKDDCPKEDMIPIFLIVAGAVLIARAFSCIRHHTSECDNEDGGESDKESSQNCCDSILNLFLFVWFFAGGIWISRARERSYDPHDGDDYCNKTLYLFAFWVLLSIYMVLPFIFWCCVCIGFVRRRCFDR